MMALDPLNNLNEWPLANIDRFVAKCNEKGIREVNITGSNTDPLLYQHTEKLISYLRSNIPGVRIGLRTNGVEAIRYADVVDLYDKFSVSITSLNPELYRQTMGQGLPPNVGRLVGRFPDKAIKANVVLCPETVNSRDIFQTIVRLADAGIERINIREPYGQARVGNPMVHAPDGERLGMPFYKVCGAEVTYWDVHYVEVESVNLYANGEVSVTYPVSKGHCPKTGKVLDQSHFTHGRMVEQWVNINKVVNQ
jgi:MoaA/NifB/PqqE/SkfB family radical SAM enzyme